MSSDLPNKPFTAALTHELKGALTASAMLSGLLIDQPALVDDPAEALLQIHHSTRRSLNVLEALIALDEQEYGETLPKTTLSPELVAREAAGSLALTEEEQDALEIRNMPRLRGHPTLMRQLYANLLANAFKFRSSERELRVICGYDPELDAWYVEDNGVGVPDTRGQEIFDQGARFNDERPGSGIGLYVVRWILQAHGGRAWFDSPRDSEGARLAFVVPG